MPYFEWKDVRLEVDDEGFMQQPELWNNNIAVALATTEHISELTPRHWKIINYLRDYYKSNGLAPMIRKLCSDTGASLRDIYDLFPSGPARGACKVAGLNKPVGCQ